MIDRAPVERLEIVRTSEHLRRVGPAWTDLWRRSGGLVFQSHDWIAAWWETAPDRAKRELHIVLAWHGETLAAALPLAVCRRRGLRLLEWAARDLTDYGDALIGPGVDAPVVMRMWEHVSAAGGFDLVYLNRLLPDASARTLLGATLGRAVRLQDNHRSDTSLRVVGAWASGEAWFQQQSKKVRQNYRRGQKFIGERGPVGFRLLAPDEPLGPVLDRLAALKRQWLTGNTLESDLFEKDSPVLPALVQILHDIGILRLFVLECDGVIVAVSVNFIHGSTMMAFVTTFDPAFERSSPGTILMIDYIKWSIDHGYKTIDFLCGAEAFKLKFATDSITMGSVMGARTMTGTAAIIIDRVRHKFKNWRVRFKERSKAPVLASTLDPIESAGYRQSLACIESRSAEVR